MGLPNLDELMNFEEVENLDVVEPFVDLKDEDFLPSEPEIKEFNEYRDGEYNPYLDPNSEYYNSKLDPYSVDYEGFNQEVKYEEEIEEEEKPSKGKKKRHKNKKKKKSRTKSLDSINIPSVASIEEKINDIKFGRLILLILAMGVLMALMYFGLNALPKNTETSISTPTKQATEVPEDRIISITSESADSNGVNFEVTSPIDQTINIQRTYKDNNGSIILCETNPQEVYSGQTVSLFANCLNNVSNIAELSTDVAENNIVYLERQD